jgi:hypothetical protein
VNLKQEAKRSSRLRVMAGDAAFYFRLRKMKTETELKYCGNREIKNAWKETEEDAMRDCKPSDCCH